MTIQINQYLLDFCLRWAVYVGGCMVFNRNLCGIS